MKSKSIQEFSLFSAKNIKENKDFTAQDIRFTRTNEALYAICMGYPQKPILIEAIKPNVLPAEKIEAVSVLGAEAPVSWSQTVEGLTITPPTLKAGAPAYTFKLKMKNEAGPFKVKRRSV